MRCFEESLLMQAFSYPVMPVIMHIVMTHVTDIPSQDDQSSDGHIIAWKSLHGDLFVTVSTQNLLIKFRATQGNHSAINIRLAFL